ncbi:hypothetical protein ACFYT3_31520 [Nocardia amikacinitolerans]|uniref:hypothetical protein n=1 Tax=Nocardia amikacinitolerans TaxID=756689 RepID=UPI0036D04816
MVVLGGDFGRNPLPAAVLGLLADAATEAARHTLMETPDTATFTARIVTADSGDSDDHPRRGAAAGDVVITVDGGDGTPVATYSLASHPHSKDPAEVLARHGWQMIGSGRRD